MAIPKRSTIRHIRLGVSQNGIDDIGQFAGNRADGGVMMLPLGTFLLVKGRKIRVMESGHHCRQPDRPAQVRGTTLWGGKPAPTGIG